MFNNKKIEELEKRIKKLEIINEDINKKDRYNKHRKLIGKTVGYYVAGFMGFYNTKEGKLLDVVHSFNKLEYHIEGYGCTKSIHEIKNK